MTNLKKIKNTGEDKQSKGQRQLKKGTDQRTFLIDRARRKY